jgi:hypothetical protein
MTALGRSCALVLMLAGLAGCGRTPPTQLDTGAREAVRDFYEGLLLQDWQRAYAVVDPGSQNRCTSEEFVRRALSYRRSLGFEPEKLLIRSCEEHGDEALAHVVFTGHMASHERRYNDAVVARRNSGKWGVVLPSDFGRRSR